MKRKMTDDQRIQFESVSNLRPDPPLILIGLLSHLKQTELNCAVLGDQLTMVSDSQGKLYVQKGLYEIPAKCSSRM